MQVKPKTDLKTSDFAPPKPIPENNSNIYIVFKK